MTETKAIDPCALASLTTGTMLCEQGFGAVQEAAEWLLGHPVWTHEFVDPDTKRALIDAVSAQFPTMPTARPADWRALVAMLRAEFGDSVIVTKGSRHRGGHPLETCTKLSTIYAGIRTMTEWLPISSAPRDGDTIVCDTDAGKPYTIAAASLRNGRWLYRGTDEEIDFLPEYWLPRLVSRNPFKIALPTPPQPDRSSGGGDG